MKKIKTVFIVGPTASGKTDISLKIAREFSGEIIAADSMQIYKGIHIASAAPNEDEKQGIEHHLFEFLELNEEFSVADYVNLSKEKIKEINKRGGLPIVVGGTGLYISSLLDNTEYISQETDFDLRKALEEEFDCIGGEEMLKKLAVFDKESAERLHPNNRRRIIRAFEVYKVSGKTITEQNELSHAKESFIEPLVLGINFQDREALYGRINKRVDTMLENGLLEEAMTTFKKGDSKGAFQAIGHKELYAYFTGEKSLEEAVALLKQQTRRYAKRQLTWFRRDDRINWFFADGTEDIYKDIKTLVRNFLKEE